MNADPENTLSKSKEKRAFRVKLMGVILLIPFDLLVFYGTLFHVTRKEATLSYTFGAITFCLTPILVIGSLVRPRLFARWTLIICALSVGVWLVLAHLYKEWNVFNAGILGLLLVACWWSPKVAYALALLRLEPAPPQAC